MKILLFYTIVFNMNILNFSNLSLFDTDFYTEENIIWAHPKSGVKEIDERNLSDFPIYYFINDNIFYRISSTNELIGDSITYGVEVGYKLEKCTVIKIEDNNIIFEKRLVYSVMQQENKHFTNIEIDTLFKINNESFFIENMKFKKQTLLTNQSKENIKYIINRHK